MRNLKRALSLALASIMLLGMMVTGAGAASNSFTDFDQIVNQEAAEVTTGLGIFDGYTDGSFGPENVVTRAEMAVIICKLLNGSDVDPGNFTGISKFNDVPAWAEGYVNYCAASGIVVGVGEGKFNPSATVTTVEAATMLLKALGYFTEEDQLKADWKTVVTGRATSQGLYGSLVLKADEGLTRDNVAELVFHTLFAQRVAYDDNRQLYVKNTNRDVVVTNGTVDRDNTFAMNTFGMWYIDGVVTANSYTEDALSESVNNGPRTDVLFDDPADYMGGSSVAHYAFEYATGLDMIGHAARTYYSIKNRAPVVYAIADRAEKVAFITYDSNSTRLSEAANEAQFRKNSILNIPVNDWKVNYDWDRTVGTLVGTADKVDLSGNETTDPSKTLLLISNSSDFAVDYVIVLDQYLDTVRRVVDRNGETAYDLTTVNADRQNIALETLAAEDFVIVTNIGKDGQMFILEKPEQVSASISKITGVSDEKGTVKSIVADSTTYAGSPVYDHKVERRELDNVTDFEDITSVGATTLLLDKLGKCIGLAQAAAPEVYAYVAQYAEKHVDGFGTENKLVAKLFLSDGTEGVYLVNTSVGNASNNSFKDYRYKQADLTKLNDVTSLSVYDDDTFNMMAGDFTTHSGLGVFKATVRADGSVVLAKLTGANSTPANGVFTDPENNAANANSTNARAVKGHSTLVAQIASGNMKAGGNVLNNAQDAAVYQTSKTVFFYINGQWGTDGSDLTVGVKTGIDNLVAFKAIADANDDNNNPTPKTYLQVMSENTRNDSRLEGRREVNAELIYGVTLSNDDLFFYRRGNYTVDWVNASRADEKATITFELYNASGERVDQTYNNKGKNFEESEITGMVANKETGWYVIGAEDLDPVVTFSAGTTLYEGDPAKRLEKNRVFVINATVDHVDYENNIYTTDERVGGITKDAVIVDLTDTGLFSSASDIERACVAGHTVKISYYYSTTSDAYKVKAVFVTGYDPYESDVNGNLRTKVYSRYNAGTGTLEVYDNGKASDAEVAASAEAAYKAAGFTVTGVLPRIAMHQDFPGRGYWGMSITREGWNGKTLNVTNSPNPVGGIMFQSYWYNVDALNMVIVNKRFDNWNVAGTAYSRNMAKENSVSVEVYEAGSEKLITNNIKPEPTEKGFTYTSAKYDTSTDIYFEIGVLKEITNMPVDMVETLQDKFQGTIEGVEAGGTLPGTTQKNDKVDVVIENTASTPAPGRATAETIVAGKSYDVYINGKLTAAATNVTADENAKLAFTYVVQDYDIAAGKLVITDIQEHTGTVNPPDENDVVVTFTDEVPTLTEGDAAPSITAPSAENATVSEPVWGDIKAPSTTMTITLTLAEDAVVKAENCKWGTITPVWNENDKTLTYTVPVAEGDDKITEDVIQVETYLDTTTGKDKAKFSAYFKDGTKRALTKAEIAKALGTTEDKVDLTAKTAVVGNTTYVLEDIASNDVTQLFKVTFNGEDSLVASGGTLTGLGDVKYLLPANTYWGSTGAVTVNNGTSGALTLASDIEYKEAFALPDITAGAIGTGNYLKAQAYAGVGTVKTNLASGSNNNQAYIQKGTQIYLTKDTSAQEGMNLNLTVTDTDYAIKVTADGLTHDPIYVNSADSTGKVVFTVTANFKVTLDGTDVTNQLVENSSSQKVLVISGMTGKILAIEKADGSLVAAGSDDGTADEVAWTYATTNAVGDTIKLRTAYLVKNPSNGDWSVYEDQACTTAIDTTSGKLYPAVSSEPAKVYVKAKDAGTDIVVKTEGTAIGTVITAPSQYGGNGDEGKGIWEVIVNKNISDDAFEKGTVVTGVNSGALKLSLNAGLTADTPVNLDIPKENSSQTGTLKLAGTVSVTNCKFTPATGMNTVSVTAAVGEDDPTKVVLTITSTADVEQPELNATGATKLGSVIITLSNGMRVVADLEIAKKTN